jgi:dTDP-4-amino-4,6-dideoxygalactose transaminase
LLPHEIHGATHIYHKFVVRHSRRAALAAHLSQAGVETKVHYPVALHREMTFVSKCEYDDRHFPNALHFADTVLTLPAHSFLEDSEVETVVCATCHFE